MKATSAPLRALISVLEHELAVLRGLRLSTDLEVATAALARERVVEAELGNARAEQARTESDDDEGSEVAA